MFREIWSELKKVVWPSREEAINLSTIVVVVSVAVGLVLGAVDYIFYALVNTLLLGR
ncbi:MAG: preprotein translocase subunit SecE [Acidobacteria bacterium]|nr:preprotein translocase subunit SecE [Acidobacteriota bacterium]